MSQDLTRLLDSLTKDIAGAKVTVKRARRIRVDVDADALPALLELLQGRGSYVHLSAITCVDWIEDRQFELVYHVWSYESNSLVSAHIRIPREPGVYLSIYDLYKPAAFFERDIHEMYGLYFEGSPSMEKFILTEWEGPPPMRKDFDAEAWVRETFNEREYNPDWLQELTDAGGGVAIRPQDIRK